MSGGNVAAEGVTATVGTCVAAETVSAPTESRWTRWRRRKEESGLRSRYFHLASPAAEKLDRALRRTGLSLAGFVEQAAERALTERLPDAPWARYIPQEYRSQEAIGSLFQFGLESASTAAEVLKAEAQRATRQHAGDAARITNARDRVDLAYTWVAFVGALDADQGLRERVFRPEGGRKVRHRFKDSATPQTPRPNLDPSDVPQATEEAGGAP